MDITEWTHYMYSYIHTIYKKYIYTYSTLYMEVYIYVNI